MNLRIALMVVSLALAAPGLRAEELQWTVTGLACPAAQFTCSPSTSMPFTVSYDFNTLSATLNPSFAHNPPGGPAGDILVNFSSSFPVTNYLAIVGGQTVGFAASGSGGFDFFGFPVGPLQYESAGGAEGFGFADNETFASPVVTEAQYTASKDPLAFMLLSFGKLNSQCPSAGNPCHLLGAGPFVADSWALEPATMTITAVPAPGPVSLFLAGILALVRSRRSERHARKTAA